MAKNKQPERWEATLLATAMAVAGAPFLFDKLASLMRTGIPFFPAVPNWAAVLLVAVGAMLLFADQGVARTESSDQRQKQETEHEL